MLVSVVLPAYNAAATLPLALASVLAQTHRDLEVLVVDDGSTDATPSILDDWVQRDDRVRVLGDGTNRGRSAARNLAMSEARGPWLCFVDADDLWAPDRVARMVAVVEADPSVDLVTDDRIGFTVTSSGRVSLRHRYPSREAWRYGGVEPLRRRGWVMDKRHVDPLVRTELVVRSGATFPEDISSAEDQAFFMQLVFAAEGCRSVRLAEPGYFYRLGLATRPADQDQNFVRSVRLAVARTGSAELERLVLPVMESEIAIHRRDSGLRARAGRLVPPDGAAWEEPGHPPLPARVRRGRMLQTLWFRRCVVMASVWADHRARPAIRADIARQLAPTRGRVATPTVCGTAPRPEPRN